jgi:hypothetical protein
MPFGPVMLVTQDPKQPLQPRRKLGLAFQSPVGAKTREASMSLFRQPGIFARALGNNLFLPSLGVIRPLRLPFFGIAFGVEAVP